MEYFSTLLNPAAKKESPDEKDGEPGEWEQVEDEKRTLPTISEIKKQAIKKLHAINHPEYNLPAELFKKKGKELIQHIHKFTTNIWEQKTLPHDWIICWDNMRTLSLYTKKAIYWNAQIIEE